MPVMCTKKIPKQLDSLRKMVSVFVVNMSLNVLSHLDVQSLNSRYDIIWTINLDRMFYELRQTDVTYLFLFYFF